MIDFNKMQSSFYQLATDTQKNIEKTYKTMAESEISVKVQNIATQAFKTVQTAFQNIWTHAEKMYQSLQNGVVHYFSSTKEEIKIKDSIVDRKAGALEDKEALRQRITTTAAAGREFDKEAFDQLGNIAKELMEKNEQVVIEKSPSSSCQKFAVLAAVVTTVAVIAPLVLDYYSE